MHTNVKNTELQSPFKDNLGCCINQRNSGVESIRFEIAQLFVHSKWYISFLVYSHYGYGLFASPESDRKNDGICQF